jgi:DNA-binding PadR family transcriptional regulator
MIEVLFDYLEKLDIIKKVEHKTFGRIEDYINKLVSEQYLNCTLKEIEEGQKVTIYSIGQRTTIEIITQRNIIEYIAKLLGKFIDCNNRHQC